MAQDVTWEMIDSSDLILTEYKEITTLLRKPVKDKRRIKYTCFDVSNNYIALGSTSGGIYLFSKETCIFHQLIPLSNGAVTHILISPDEKVIALSTIDGNVCLVVFKPTVKEALISSKAERNGESITSLCWNDNSTELYIGDENGSIHVMGLSIFTVKRGIFQDPACPIMGLDHKIVQMDFCSPLLLISTILNCYICDTVEGQYEKVGVRTRQGEFGACFYNPIVKQDREIPSIIQKHSPSNNSDLEEALGDDDTSIDRKYLTIYCARPGSRLWEAKSNGKIVKTHNFKDALAIPPAVIHKQKDSTLSRNADLQNGIEWPPQSLKFSPLFIISKEYLFTYNSNALYILDPVNSTVILWNNEYKDIAMGNVIDNNIYLMTNAGDFHCLELKSIDLKSPNSFATKNFKSLSNKLDSGVVVVNQRNIIPLKSVPNEENVISDIDKFEVENLNRQNLMVDNLEFKTSNGSLDEAISDVRDHIDKDGEEKDCPLSINLDSRKASMVKEEKQNLSKDEISCLINDVQTIYTLANSMNNKMSDNEIDRIIKAVEEMIIGVKESWEKLKDKKQSVLRSIETAEQYYRNIFLSKLSNNQLIQTRSEYVLNQTMISFLGINVLEDKKYSECKCGFPQSIIKKLEEPKFLEIGKILLERYSSKENQNDCINLCKKVPYMWRIYVQRIYYSNGELDDDLFDERIFAQCLQTRDDIILSFILFKLKNKKQWEFAIKALNNLKLKQCLLCELPIESKDDENDLSINWNNVANEIMKREGSDAALKFLNTVTKFLPSLSFNRSLFQSLIFTKILNNHGFKRPVDFNQKLNGTSHDKYSSLCCPKVQNQLLETLEKDLNRPMNKDVFGTQAHHWGLRYKLSNVICLCCTLPLQTPVLLENNGLALFPCGHCYHVNCLIQKKILKCNLHS